MRIDPRRTEAKHPPNWRPADSWGLASISALLIEWASRGALALLFVFGMLATASASPGLNRAESVIEGGSEELETHVPNGVRARANRHAGAGGPPLRMLEDPRVPSSLVPVRLDSTQVRPRWHVPRRIVPAADDDDDELG
ncbi:hypothetical protein ACNOYE_29415 [Nannocystaceae bacterium ST9]